MIMSESTTTSTDICTNCGKDNATNICNKCKTAKYCNAACKKKHRHKHKKDCEEYVKRAAELHDKELFKPPPHKEDCPICFLRMPSLDMGYKYMSCCGKVICCGCVHANKGLTVDQLCPFCRIPAPKGKETIERIKKRMEAGDALAIDIIGGFYSRGEHGLPRNRAKAIEYLHQAAELGYAGSYHNMGLAYLIGSGVERDMKKATHYYELAAMMGDADARYTLGIKEKTEGNMDRALKHWMIAVESGHTDSLKNIKELFTDGHATKGDYRTALRAHQSYLNEIKSIPRDAAVAHDENYKYY